MLMVGDTQQQEKARKMYYQDNELSLDAVQTRWLKSRWCYLVVAPELFVQLHSAVTWRDALKTCFAAGQARPH